MATFFGEVLPVFSRAVADFDEEEDVSFHKECRVHWTETTQQELRLSSSKCLDCDILIVATGPTATAFVETCVMGADPELLATISEEEETTQDREQHKPSIHRLQKHPKVIVYKGQAEVFPEQSFNVVAQVLEHIPKSVNIIVLCTQPAVDYKGGSAAGDIRALKTSTFSHKVPCGFIETPNIVAGLPAQVMTQCQVERRPAVMYVVYMENMYFDMSYVNTFCQILQVSPLQEISKDMVMSIKEVEKKADQYAQSHNFFT